MRHFILSVFDPDQWCPVLEARFQVDDLALLASLLGAAAQGDAELLNGYELSGAEAEAIAARFGVAFDPSPLWFQPETISLRPQRGIDAVPYLVHTGYELPLLLAGRKKLARFSERYPPDRFDGEDRFDAWVERGVLRKIELREPIPTAHRPFVVRPCDGVRRVFYTLAGEEWRVQAMLLLNEASAKSGGWNEYFERLEGMLFGYSDAENDWWIDQRRRHFSWAGRVFCCAVDADGLAWLETAGWRALPPSPEPTVMLYDWDLATETEVRDLAFANAQARALVGFAVGMRGAGGLEALRGAGPWALPSETIALLNRSLTRAVACLARR